MSSYKPDVKYIGSIYPGPLPVIMRSHGPSPDPRKGRMTRYELKPVPRGKKPFSLEIQDSFEDVIGGLAGIQQGSKLPKIAKPVPVEEIVQDLLNHWTGGLHNVPQGAKPGIIEIVNSAPSQAELKQMEEQQVFYFEYLFQEGERLHKESAWKDITDTMRLAAEWLGYDRVWSNRAMAKDSVPCPFCTTIIPALAFVCPQCQKVIRAIPPELAKLQEHAR